MDQKKSRQEQKTLVATCITLIMIYFRLVTITGQIGVYIVTVALWIGIIERMQIGAHVSLAGSPIRTYQSVAAVTNVPQLWNGSSEPDRV